MKKEEMIALLNRGHLTAYQSGDHTLMECLLKELSAVNSKPDMAIQVGITPSEEKIQRWNDEAKKLNEAIGELKSELSKEV